MPFEILRNDIVNMQVDAIVNTANPRPVVGSGTDAGIHRAAGPQLLEARKRIGRIAPGQAAITPGFDLPAKYVIHTVGPAWRGGLFGEREQLRSCYANSLALAKEHGCASIAFPLISTGNYGFPKPLALQIVMQAVSEFLLENEMHVILVVFDRSAVQLSEKLVKNVASYIDENYVQKARKLEYPTMGPRQRRFPEIGETAILADARVECAPMAAPAARPRSLEDMLKEADAGFSQTLLGLIDKSGKKDSEVYKKANVDRKLFSKIRNQPGYRPSKSTAVAFAIALELDLDKTRDLIGRAGYALTHSSKFDIIIEYFILNGNYNIHEINMTLFEFDQNLLGS